MRSFFLRALSRIVIVVSASLLAGCAALPTTAPDAAALSRHALDDFMIEGRFSVRQDEQNHSGRLRWKHAGGSDEVLLASPFGQGVAEIVADARRATLTTSDGKTYSAADSESLTEQVLGYRLPLSLLADWVRGRLVPEHVAERDASGRPLTLRDPARLSAALVRSEGNVRVETFTVKAAGVDATASGDLATGLKMSGSFDLAAMQAQARDLIDLGAHYFQSPTVMLDLASEERQVMDEFIQITLSSVENVTGTEIGRASCRERV